MTVDNSLEHRDSFPEDDPTGCRIETQGGTVYWLSQADGDGCRWIVREHLRSSDTNTMVMHKVSYQGGLDLGDKFRARLASDVEIGAPFVLEVIDMDTRILSEPVATIEVGNVPAMLFG